MAAMVEDVSLENEDFYDEDEDVVEKIEAAQNARLQAEKDDNMQLKRQVTSLQGAVRRATLKADPS